MTVAVPTTQAVAVISLGRLSAGYVFTGGGSTPVTGTLASLTRSDETEGTPAVDIHAIYWTTSATNLMTITRNGVILYYLQGSGSFIYEDHLCDNRGNANDIVVDLGTAGGTITLGVRKTSGFNITVSDQNPY
jgi:hypothetical protein